MKRLVLLGGGHNHVHVLDALARKMPAGVETTLVSPHAHQVYSGMLPGWLAGHCHLRDWVWRWQDRIDRAFIARFSRGLPAATNPPPIPGTSHRDFLRS